MSTNAWMEPTIATLLQPAQTPTAASRVLAPLGTLGTESSALISTTANLDSMIATATQPAPTYPVRSLVNVRSATQEVVVIARMMMNA